MTNESDELLNDLLARWHHWAGTYSHAKGYPREIPTRRLHTISNQHANENGEWDGYIEDHLMTSFDACLDAVQQPHRTALQINARNLATGSSVWRSPRLPENDMDRAAMVVEARAMLFVIISRQGLA